MNDMERKLQPEGAGVLLYSGEDIILLERNPYYKNSTNKKHELEYPGGKVNSFWETYKQCVIRETLEKTAYTLHLRPEQLTKFVCIKSPQEKGICLFIVELSSNQNKLVPFIRDALQYKYNSEPTEQKSIDLVMVKKQKLIDSIVQNVPINGLDLRSINKILLRELLNQNLL